MTSPAWTEVQTAVGGTLRLACGDRGAMALFDVSVEGFWRSFRAAILCYPLYLMLVLLRVSPAQWTAAGAPRIVVVETITYVVAWTMFPLLMLQLTRMFNCQHRFLPFMVAYNWSQIPATVLTAIIAADRAAGLFPPAAGQFASLAATVAVLVYEWYIARVALDVTGAQAALGVVLDVALGLALGRVALGLYQPGLF